MLTGPHGTLADVGAMRRALPHDITNTLAASALVLESGLVETDAVGTALATFVGPKHRLEHIADIDGVGWYNDSKATTPHAASAAIRAFDGIVLIAGGYDKGVDLSSMAAEPDRVDALIAIGAHRSGTGHGCSAASTASRSSTRSTKRSNWRRGSPRPATPCCCRPAVRASTSTPTSRPAATISVRSSMPSNASLAAPPRPTLNREIDHDRTAHRRRSPPRRARASARTDDPSHLRRPGGRRRPPVTTDATRRWLRTRHARSASTPAEAARSSDLGERHGRAIDARRPRSARPADGHLLRDRRRGGGVRDARPRHGAVGVGSHRSQPRQFAVPHLQPPGDVGRASGSSASSSRPRCPYTMWRRLIVPLGLLGVLAMCLPFVPGLGASINGASSWIRVGGLSVQPSEFLKLAVVVLAADLLARRPDDVVDARRAIVPITTGGRDRRRAVPRPGRPRLGVVLAAIVFSVAWIAGVPVTHLATVCAGGAAVALLFVVSSPRRLARFTPFTNVAAEKDHLAYQIYQGYLSIASGGLTGSGIGGGKGKLGYLPYAQSDFIFAVIADELGLRRHGGDHRRVHPARRVRHPDRARRAGPIRHAARRWHRHMVRRAGHRQPRRRRRTAARHRPHVAVLLGRRQLAVRQHDRRRSAVVGVPSSRSVVTRRAEVGRRLLRRRGRGRHRRPRAAGDRGRRRARRRRSRPSDDPLRRLANAGSRRRLLPDTPYPPTFLDVVGFQRRLDRRNLAFVPKMIVATRSMIGRCAPTAQRRRVGRRLRQHARSVRRASGCGSPDRRRVVRPDPGTGEPPGGSAGGRVGGRVPRFAAAASGGDRCPGAAGGARRRSGRRSSRRPGAPPARRSRRPVPGRR